MRLLVLLCLFFSAGCLCFLYREKIPHSTAIFVISLVVLGGSLPLRVFRLIAPVALSYAFLWLAFALPFGRFDRKGDFSYGAYIYAFPVQQGMALLRMQEEGFGLYFTSSLLLTSLLAFLSYRLIEAPSDSGDSFLHELHVEDRLAVLNERAVDREIELPDQTPELSRGGAQPFALHRDGRHLDRRTEAIQARAPGFHPIPPPRLQHRVEDLLELHPGPRMPTTAMKAVSTSLAPSPIMLMRASRIMRSSGGR